MTIQQLHAAWLSADTAWTAAMQAAYPRAWPGDIRYIPKGRGELGTPLRAAYEAYTAARDAFHAAGGFGKLFNREKAS